AAMVFSGWSPAPPRWANGIGWGQSRNSPFPMYGFDPPHGADRDTLRTVRQHQHRGEPPMAPPAAFDATGYRRQSNSSRRSVAASDAHSYEGPSSVDAKNSTTWRIATAAASIAWPCATPG